jgi:hypothetical protein
MHRASSLAIAAVLISVSSTGSDRGPQPTVKGDLLVLLSVMAGVAMTLVSSRNSPPKFAANDLWLHGLAPAPVFPLRFAFCAFSRKLSSRGFTGASSESHGAFFASPLHIAFVDLTNKL